MSVDDNVLSIVGAIRRGADRIVDETVRGLVTAWVGAWDALEAEWQAVAHELAAAAADGWPTRSQVTRLRSVETALDLTYTRLETLAREAGLTISGPLGQVVAQAAAGEARVIAAQLPPGSTQLIARFDRVDPQALEAIVARTTEQITSLLRPLAAHATTALHAALIRGVALGENPRETARRLLRRLGEAFNGGLTRALVVARTEMLDAHRAATKAQDLANLDVVAGWRWMATLDVRTCESCLAMNGQLFPPEADGPEDHQQGRCARVTVTKSWRELGFDLDEPPGVFPDAQAWFEGLSEAEQLRIMGRERLDLLRSGQITWADLATRRTSAGWRDSYVPTSVRDLHAKAAAGGGSGGPPSGSSPTGGGTSGDPLWTREYPTLARDRWGRTTIAHGTYPEPHEIASTDRLNQVGFDTHWRAINNAPGAKNPDIDMAGGVWDIKSPKGSSEKNTIDSQLKRAHDQGVRRVVLDCARTPLDDKFILDQLLNRLAGSDRFDEIILISKDRTVTRFTRTDIL